MRKLYQPPSSNRSYITESSATLCWLPNSYQILKRWAGAHQQELLHRHSAASLMCVCACVCVLMCMGTRQSSYPHGSWRPTSELSGKSPPSVLHYVPPMMQASHRGRMGRDQKDLGQVLFAAPLPIKLMGCQWWTIRDKSLSHYGTETTAVSVLKVLGTFWDPVME